VPEGTSVMRASNTLGISIPKLCATDNMEAWGSCRLCAVEIEGPPRHPRLLHDARGARHGRPHPDRQDPQAPPRRDGALHLRPPARLPDLRRQRRLRASGHGRRRGPARRPLRGAPRVRGLHNHFLRKDTPGRPNPQWLPKDDSNPYFTYDPAKCIVCSRCVRACEEVQGTFALTIEGRGFDSRVSAGMGGDSFLSSDCVSCGACVQACPDRDAPGEVGHRDRHPRPQGRHHLRLLRRRLLLRGRDARRPVVRMTPGSTARPTAAIPASRAASPGATPPTRTASSSPMIRETITDPWEVVLLGRGHRLRRDKLRDIQSATASRPSAASPPRAAPTRRPTSSRR
jgi:formate dehydrogenase major subunit